MAEQRISKARSILGIAVGVVLLLSAGMHSILGAKAMDAKLAATNAPPDLVTGLRIGWQFGGAAMVAFGIIVIALFVKARKEMVSLLPVAVIAALYLVFGGWALFATKFDPFFLIFIIPGLVLAGVSRGARMTG